MNNTIVIVDSRFQINKLISFIKKSKDKKRIRIIATNYTTETELRKNNIPFKTIKDYSTKKMYEKVNKISQNMMVKISNLKLYKKTFDDFLKYDGISLWNMARWDIILYLIEVIKSIEILKQIIKREKPTKIILFGTTFLFEKSTISMAKHKKIPLSLIEPNYVYNFITSFNRLKPYIVKYFYQIRELQRRVSIKFLKSNEPQKPISKNNILFFVSTRNQTVAAIPVIRELEKNKKNKPMIIKFGGIITNYQINKALKKQKIYCKNIESYIDFEANQRIKKSTKNLRDTWNNLKNNKNFKKLITYDNISIWDLTEDLFSFLFFSRAWFVQIIKFIESIKNIIKIEKPKMVVILNNAGALEKVIAEVSRFNKIPSLYIPHFMASYHPGYGHITTTRAAIPGEYDKKVFIETNTNPNKLVITGQPKYDELLKKIKKLNKDKLYNELNLKPNKGLVLLTTQLRSEEENQLLIRTVVNTLKKFPEKQLVIKLHPREINKIFYERILSEMNYKNALITKDTDIYGLIASSDVLITYPSNTALEAIILNKPLIILNLMNKPDEYPFVEDGAAIGVYKPENLELVLRKVLSDKKTKNKLEANRKKIVTNFIYKLDGHASERISNLINKMIKNDH